MGTFFEDLGNAIGTVNDYVSAPLKPLQNVANNVNAGVLSALPSIPGVLDLARAGGEALYKTGTGDPNGDQSYLETLKSNFENEIIDQKKLEDVMNVEAERFQKANPTATPSDMQAHMKEYGASDEFHKIIYDNMSAGLGFSQKAEWLANEIAGVGKRPDELNAAEAGLQILGQSVIGPTKALTEGFVKGATERFGERAVNNFITKSAAKVAELATPVTFPLTPGNVAANAAVGVAVDNTMRYVQGDDTLLTSNKDAQVANAATQAVESTTPYDPNKQTASPTGTTDAAIGILGAAALLFGGKVSKAVGDEIVEHADDAFLRRVRNEPAASLADQSTRLKPTINSDLSDVADAVQPVTDVARKAGANEGQVADLDAIASQGTSVNRGVRLSNVYNFGKLDGFQDVIPLKQFGDTINGMQPEERQLLNDYVYARMAKQDRALQATSFEGDVASATAKYNDAVKGGNRRSIKAAETELTDALNSRFRQRADTDPSMRPNMEQWSNADVDNIIRIGENNPAIKKIGEAIQKTSNDFANYAHQSGLITAEARARWMKDRPMYVPLAEKDFAGMGVWDKAKTIASRTFNDFMNGPKGLYERGVGLHASRDVSGDGAKVNQPRDILDALQEMYYTSVHEATVNSTRRDVVDRMHAIGSGTVIRKVPPNADIGDRPHVVLYRDGHKEMHELADSALARALNLGPQSAMPIINQSRKLAQTTTTGTFAPWFAPKAFIWDNVGAAVLKPAGRSLGLIDTYARRAAQGTALEGAVNKTLDRVIDPTAVVQSLAAIPYSLGMKAAGAAGQLVARDLVGNNAFLDAIAKQSPQGAKLIEAVGQRMALALDQSVYHIYHQNIGSHTYAGDVRVRGLAKINNRLGTVSKVGGTLLNGYRALLESVHDATKMSFFVQNYGQLALKYGDNIPDAAMKQLVRDTKQLVGDMSRTSGRRSVQMTSSMVPYANATIQGTRYTLKSAFGKNASVFWPRIVGFALPVIGAYAFMDKWQGASEYWNERVTPNQRITNIPLPKISVLLEAQQTGKMPQFTPDKLDMIPIPPELTMFTEPLMIGLRTLGLVGGQGGAGLGTPMDQLKQAFSQVTSFMMPPAVEAVLSYNGMTSRYGGISALPDDTGGQGANAEMMTPGSEIPATVYNVVSSLLGSGANLAMQTFNAFDIAADKEHSYTKAFGDAMAVAGSEFKSKLPQISVPGVWDAQRRYGASTPEATYVYNALNDLNPIIGSSRQISVEHDADHNIQQMADEGFAAPQKISDPLLKNISEAVYTRLKQKGKFKELSDTYTDLRRQVQALDRMRNTSNQSKWLTQRNLVIQQQQSIRSSQAKELQKMEHVLMSQVGPAFEQRFGVPFSYKNLSKLVQKDVGTAR